MDISSIGKKNNNLYNLTTGFFREKPVKIWGLNRGKLKKFVAGWKNIPYKYNLFEIWSYIAKFTLLFYEASLHGLNLKSAEFIVLTFTIREYQWHGDSLHPSNASLDSPCSFPCALGLKSQLCHSRTRHHKSHYQLLQKWQGWGCTLSWGCCLQFSQGTRLLWPVVDKQMSQVYIIPVQKRNHSRHGNTIGIFEKYHIAANF